MGFIKFYKPTYNWGAPHCSSDWVIFFTYSAINFIGWPPLSLPAWRSANFLRAIDRCTSPRLHASFPPGTDCWRLKFPNFNPAVSENRLQHVIVNIMSFPKKNGHLEDIIFRHTHPVETGAWQSWRNHTFFCSYMEVWGIFLLIPQWISLIGNINQQKNM